MVAVYQTRRKIKTAAIGAVLLMAAFAGHPGMTAVVPVAERLRGRIVLQVERAGEAWYISPATSLRSSLGRPADAFTLLRTTGIGISDKDLKRLPIGLISLPDAPDADDDGLADRLESALGTDPGQADTDGDGHSDGIEIANGYDPLLDSGARTVPDKALADRLSGAIVLQVERAGEAWYIDPASKKRYYLGAPSDALAVMRQLGLGISERDIAQIPQAIPASPTPLATVPLSLPITNPGGRVALNDAASAVAAGTITGLESSVTETFLPAFTYTIDYLDGAGRQTLAELMQTATVADENETHAVYTNRVPFNGESATIRFQLEADEDGRWRLSGMQQ